MLLFRRATITSHDEVNKYETVENKISDCEQPIDRPERVGVNDQQNKDHPDKPVRASYPLH